MSNIKWFVLDSVDFTISQKLERSDILILSPTLLLSWDLSKVIVCKSTHEWPRVTTSEHAWPRVTTRDHEWTRVTTSDHEWLRVTTSDHELTTSDHELTTSQNASKYFVDVMMTSLLHHFIKWQLFNGKLTVSWDLNTCSRHFHHFSWNGGGARGRTGRGMGGTNFPPPTTSRFPATFLNFFSRFTTSEWNDLRYSLYLVKSPETIYSRLNINNLIKWCNDEVCQLSWCIFTRIL